MRRCPNKEKIECEPAQEGKMWEVIHQKANDRLRITGRIWKRGKFSGPHGQRERESVTTR